MRDDRANPVGWIGLSVGCMVLLIVAAVSFAVFGIPGTTGGTSQNQQQTFGAPQPGNDIRDGQTRQNTTGYGAKDNQP